MATLFDVFYLALFDTLSIDGLSGRLEYFDEGCELRLGHSNQRCHDAVIGYFAKFVVDHGRFLYLDLFKKQLGYQYHALASGTTLIRFNTEATFVINENGAQVEYYDKKQKKSQRVNCDFVAGCDGFHGISRRSIPSTRVRIVERYYDSSWLAILAEAPPSADHIIYALHPNGFAGHMLRSDKISRYYLQVKNTDDVSNWPDERVWTELELRLGKEGWRLIQGEILEKQIIPMRNFVIAPMQYQRLFLAGDSAHIITPAGGKGMNLAIQDSLVLGELFVGHYRGECSADLNAYSSIRLPDIWHAQEFSSSFLDILSRSNDAFETDLFTRKLNESRLLQLRDNTLVATDFSKKYAGAMVDPYHYAYGN